MKSYWILFLCLSCLGAGGCSGMCQRKLSALERENSQLNGLLWELQFELEGLEDENKDLRKRLGGSEEDADSPRPAPSRRRSNPKESTEPPPFDPGEFRPPVIEFPSEPTPNGSVPESLLPGPDKQTRTRRRTGARVSTVGLEKPAPPEPKIEAVPAAEVALDSSRIARIHLAPLIGTLHLDNKPGDDGLVIVVEPWDRSNQMLADAGDISVALIDPEEPADSARYARWEFEAEETVNFFRDGDLPGLHLELPWPDDPPKHDRLHLVVRYKTSDGRTLYTDSIVEVDLGGSGGWVATDAPRVRPYERPIAFPKPEPELLAASARPIPEPKPLILPHDLATVPRKIPEPTPRDDVSDTPQSLATRVRTVSLPRETPAPTPRERQSESAGSIRPKSEPTPIRKPEPEPESPDRQRPVWSPDRPW